MDKDSTEISVSADGFGFKTDGEASERLANAALDFLSPITEGAGFLGTKLRGYRMEAALKATLRAKQICEENSLPINPVPPKFLLQWVEGASLEDIADPNNLVEIWANLLASTSSDDANKLMFIDIIKKLDKSHLDFLRYLISESRLHLYLDAPFEYAAHRIKERIRSVCSANLKSISSKRNLNDIIETQRSIVTSLISLDGAVLDVHQYYLSSSSPLVVTEDDDHFDFSSGKFYEGYSDIISDALSGLNLTKDVWIEDIYPFHEDCEMVVKYTHLTDFGAQFLDACNVKGGKP